MSTSWAHAQPHPVSRRTLAALALVTGLTIGWLANETDPATVGSTTVPAGLSCYEDEIVGFDQSTPAPHTLACIHLDEVGR